MDAIRKQEFSCGELAAVLPFQRFFVPTRPIAKRATKELDAMVAEFDREFVADSFGPMDDKAEERLQRAKRKRGRPRVGAGSQMISVTIEKRLLKKVDRLAKRLGVSRAKLIAVGLLKITKAAEPLEH